MQDKKLPNFNPCQDVLQSYATKHPGHVSESQQKGLPEDLWMIAKQPVVSEHKNFEKSSKGISNYESK